LLEARVAFAKVAFWFADCRAFSSFSQTLLASSNLAKSSSFNFFVKAEICLSSSFCAALTALLAFSNSSILSPVVFSIVALKLALASSSSFFAFSKDSISPE